MSEPTTPPPADHSEPATGPVYTSAPDTGQPPAAPQTVYVPQPPSRLNKAAAWVAIAAGSVFIIAVIFGAGFVLGKNVGDGSRGHHRGHEMVLRQGPMMPPGPPGGFQRGPGFSGPFTGEGPLIDAPRPSGAPAAPTAPPRP